MWHKKRSNEEEDEETKRRKQERGKRRFEEGFDHVNEEFFSNWQSRTKRGGASNNTASSQEGGAGRAEGTSSSKNFDFNFGEKDQESGQHPPVDFHGRDVHVCVNLSF